MKKVIFLFCFSFISSSITLTQWSNDPTINTPICTAPGNQTNIQIVGDGEGGAYIVWEDYRSFSSQIFAQRVNQDGVILWTENGIQISDAAQQRNPSIVLTHTNSLMITFESYGSVYCQNILSNGDRAWGPTGIRVSTSSVIQENSLIGRYYWITENSYIVAWEQRSGNGDIYAQKFNIMGSKLWGNEGIPVSNGEFINESSPYLLIDGIPQKIYILYQEHDPGIFPPFTEHYNIMLARLSTEGTIITDFQIFEYKNIEDKKIVYNSGKSIVLAEGPSQIKICCIDADDNIAWEKVILDGTYQSADIESFNEQGVIVIWSQNSDIYAQKVDLNGNNIWPEGGKLIVSQTGNQINPKIKYNYIIWEDDRSGNVDIYAQRIDTDGNPLWVSGGIPVSTKGNDQFNFDFYINSYDESSLIVWEDLSNNDGILPDTSDIYGERIDSSGFYIHPCDTGIYHYNSLSNKKEGMGFKIPTVAKLLSHGLYTDNYGNIYITGYSDSAGTKCDYLTAKYDNSGNLLWTARYDGTVNKNDYAYAVISDLAGNVYVTGESDGGSTKSDIVTIKYNSDGIQQWVARYNNSGVNKRDAGYDIALSPLHDVVIITGESSGGSTKSDIVTIAYNASTGDELWVKKYNGPSSKVDKAYSISPGLMGFVVAGESDGEASKSDIVAINYDYTGNQNWVYRYNGEYSKKDIAFKVIYSGINIFITGASESNNKFDGMTIKLDNSGNELWTSRYNYSHNKNDILYDMILDDDGDVYVTGTSESSTSKYDYLMIKYSGTDGTQIWFNRFDGGFNKNDIARSITICNPNRQLYVTGSGQTNNTSKLNFYTLVLDANSGALESYTSYNGLGSKDDIAFNIRTRSEYCCLAIAGISNEGSQTKNDYTLLLGKPNFIPSRYNIPSTILSDEGNFDDEPQDFILHQNYPNPFNPITKINFGLPVQSQVTLEIFNVLGQKVATILDNELFDEGTHEIEISVKDLSSGVYFYRLRANGLDEESVKTTSYIENRKMIILK